MKKYLCIHGHFYQPPRENPWIEEIELQESAAPYHDWNARILKECYESNCYARILDGDNKIVDIISNYSLISFNFGPTLLSWLEKKAPDTYAHILEADRLSLQRWGHGNAIAQVYNHMILPLANERDQETQVIWGLEDFKARFQRDPEAMWLSETAVNGATLAMLQKFGLKFIILAPNQAQRIRPLQGGVWKDVSDGSIDPTHPYRCFLIDNNGRKIKDKFIDIFFYDGAVSGELSFGNLLFDGNLFADRLNQAYNPGKQKVQLIHIASDGETYGHHKKFGEMALAYALRKAEERHGLTLTNYGTFLEQFPPEWEVDLKRGRDGEGTAWSCAHGVGRWRDDCGCKVSWQGSWNQKWRKPLREALDIHRNNLAELFEHEGRKFFKDCWDARNGYIRLILDRSRKNLDEFLSIYAKEDLKEEAKVQALKLLEMQRHAMLMYTSCGWFFDEISGLETVQILQYADRALQLAETFTKRDLEGPLLEKLALAKSNIAGYGSGRDVYHRFVRPARISMEKVLNHFVISSAFNEKAELPEQIYHYQVEVLDYEKKEMEKSFLISGQVKMKSCITAESEDFFYVLAFLGSYYFRVIIKQMIMGMDYSHVKKVIFLRFEEDQENIFQIIGEILGEHYYSLRDMFQEEKQRILRQLIFNEMGAYEDIYTKMFDDTRETMEAMIKEGLIIPMPFRAAAEYTLSRRLSQEIRQLRNGLHEVVSRGELKKILRDASTFGYSLNLDVSRYLLSSILRDKTEELQEDFCKHTIEETNELLAFVNGLGLEFNKMESQNIFYNILSERFQSLIEKVKTGDEQARSLVYSLSDLAQKMDFSTGSLLKQIDAAVPAD